MFSLLTLNNTEMTFVGKGTIKYLYRVSDMIRVNGRHMMMDISYILGMHLWYCTDVEIGALNSALPCP